MMNFCFKKRPFKYIFKSLLLIFLFVSIAQIGSATDKNLANLSYQESVLVVENGNLTLTFHNSTNENKNDLSIIKLAYLSDFNVTILRIVSNDIVYNYSFVNNTKTYRYKNNNSTANLYLVRVNYSSIKTPINPAEYYIVLLEAKNKTIANLQSALQNQTVNLTTYNSTLVVAMNRIQELEQYKTETTPIVEDYNAVNEQNDVLRDSVATLTSDKESLSREVDGLTKTVNSLTSPFATSYTKGGVDVFYFNASWFVIGGIIFLLIFVFFSSKRTSKFREQGKESIKKTIQRKEVEVPDFYDIREERPDIEKDILKKPPKDVSKEVDDAIHNKRLDNALLRKRY